MDLRSMLAAARVELLDPKPQKPSYRHLLHLATAVVQNRLNRVANTGRAWTVGETTLDVAAGESDYQLSASGIGKVLDVTTYDPNSTEWVERQVPFHDLSDMADDGVDGAWSGAARIAFFRKGGTGQLWARVRPTPSDAASYRVSYSIGNWAASAALGNSPLLSQFHHLFVAELARDALPAAEWSGDAKSDEAKRASLERSLSRRIAEYDKEFRVHTAALNTPRNTFRAEAFAIE